MKKTLLLVIALPLVVLAVDPTPAQSVPVSPDLRAQYWRASAEEATARASVQSSVNTMRAACEAQGRDLSADQKGEPVCILKPDQAKK